jgi:prepilin-type N-terminal cleavage/methylation domain-containing protein
MTCDCLPTRRLPVRGFTLIEVLVVVALIAIMAAVIVPRFSGNEQRQFQLAVDQVADLLTMYAQRESSGSTSVGLEQDYGRNELLLVVLDIDPTRRGAPSAWMRDHNTRPVRLPKFMRPEDVVVFADGEAVDISQWPLTNNVGQDRPSIEIAMYGPRTSANLKLPPYAVAPIRTDDLRDSAGVRERVDLDASGRSREDW